MEKINKSELLNKFKTKTKEVEVKSWGMNVEIRELTVAESSEVQSLMLKDSTADELSSGTVNISMGKFEESKIKAVSLSLVNPKLSEGELSGMGSAASEGITEIYDAIGEFNKPKK